MTLPKPDDIAQRHSKQLLSLIYDEIERAGGKISFANYMHLCLYTQNHSICEDSGQK